MSLTKAQAWEIYQLAWYANLPQRAIGGMYGVRPATVSAIKRGELWGFQEPWIPPDRALLLDDLDCRKGDDLRPMGSISKG